MTYAWFNDRLRPLAELCIDPADRGFLLGDGIFETIRLTNGALWLLDAHMARLSDGANLLQIPLPPLSQIIGAFEAVVTANNSPEGSLRLTLTRGRGPRGILPPQNPQPTLLITQAPPSPAQDPCRLHLSRYRRDSASPLSRIKHLNYLPQILARIEAEKAGFDDAILLSCDGLHIAEASAANIVILKENVLLTPPLTDGALPGVSRRRLLDCGLCEEAHITTDQLQQSEAAWLISSLSLRPVMLFEQKRFSLNPAWTSRIARSIFGP